MSTNLPKILENSHLFLGNIALHPYTSSFYLETPHKQSLQLSKEKYLPELKITASPLKDLRGRAPAFQISYGFDVNAQEIKSSQKT
jgi:hypothetical protein